MVDRFGHLFGLRDFRCNFQRYEFRKFDEIEGGERGGYRARAPQSQLLIVFFSI